MTESSLQQTLPESENIAPDEEVVETTTEEVSEETNQEENNDNEQVEFDPKSYVRINDPQIQRKFDHVYGQMKQSDNRNQMLTQMLEVATQKLDALEKRATQTDEAEVEQTLFNRLTEARESGNLAEETKVLKELVDFKAGSQVKQQLAKAKPPEKQQIDPDVQLVASLATETDNSGNVVRPWLRVGHPEYFEAVKEGFKIATENPGLDVANVMQRLDISMKNKNETKKNPRAIDPLQSTNLTNSKTTRKIKMTDQERTIARKLGISEDQYEKGKKYV